MITHAQWQIRLLEESTKRHIECTTVSIAVEILQSPASQQPEKMVHSCCQMEFCIAVTAVRRAHISCRSNAKSTVLIFPGQHGNSEDLKVLSILVLWQTVAGAACLSS